MSRVGRCIDNGPMEGFWGILKTEMYYLHKFENYENLKKATENYIDYYKVLSLFSIFYRYTIV
ncbi:IS3 family transposase [Clostridium estertheticum]|nr:IS3 family transposase [Clostridium estertheticum]WLC87387.1 IS3 family transposase [Clostridium estertheticum]